MSQLSEVINKFAEDGIQNGFDATAIAPTVWDALDDEARRTCGLQEIERRLKSAAARFAKRAISAIVAGQPELPFHDLPGAVALDIDGRGVKAFVALARLEFERARSIRRKQLQDDKRVLDAFDDFEIAARPYWEKNPGMTAGEILNAIVREKRAA